MKLAVLILSSQKEANARAVAVMTNGIHGIQKIIGFVLKGNTNDHLTQKEGEIINGKYVSL